MCRRGVTVRPEVRKTDGVVDGLVRVLYVAEPLDRQSVGLHLPDRKSGDRSRVALDAQATTGEHLVVLVVALSDAVSLPVGTVVPLMARLVAPSDGWVQTGWRRFFLGCDPRARGRAET